MQENTVETGNIFGVGAQMDHVIILGRVHVIRKMTKAQAVNLAAYLVAVADPERKEFDPLFQRVVNT